MQSTIKIHEAGTSSVIRCGDARPLSVEKKNSVAGRRETNLPEVPREIGIVEILQSLSYSMQLPTYFSEGAANGGSEIAYQFQSVDEFVFDVLHDVVVHHPL